MTLLTFGIILTFLLVLVANMLLRVRTGNKFEIKVNDIVVALVPIFLILFLRGDIASMKIGDLEIEKAFKEAYRAEISSDLTSLSGSIENSVADLVERMESPGKGPSSEIPELVRKNTKVLSLRLGHLGYVDNILAKYFDEIATLEYVIVNNPDGTFHGMIGTSILIDLVSHGDFSWQALKNALESSDTETISGLPEYIGLDKALTSNNSRIEALEKFEASDRAVLPVLNEKYFIGILERDKLSNQLLITISKLMNMN